MSLDKNIWGEFLNIELVGLPCAGKTTMAKKILAETDLLRGARFRDKLVNMLLHPRLIIQCIRLAIQIYKKKVPPMLALIRSVHLMPLCERQYLISDEGVIVYSSAVGMDPTNTDFTYLDNYHATRYIFLEPPESVLSKHMAKRGRLSIEYNSSEAKYKASFSKRAACFENWKLYLEKNGFEYAVITNYNSKKLHPKIKDFFNKKIL